MKKIIQETKKLELQQYIGEAELEEGDEAPYGYSMADQYKSLIGEVIIEFNDLESMLDFVICEIIESASHSMGMLIIDGLLYGKKVDMLRKWIMFADTQITGGKNAKEIIDMIGNLVKSGSLRNFIAHARRSAMTKKRMVNSQYKMESTGIITTEYKKITAPILKSYISFIKKTNRQLEKFGDKRRFDIIHSLI